MSIQDDWRDVPIGESVQNNVHQQIVRADHVPGQPDALGGDMAVEALPTWCGGTTFRSALEASWAATLDTLRVVWEYEPEMVTLPSGATYIPDFKLPEIGAWLEVKGTGVPRVEKAVEFGKSLACDCGVYTCTCDWPGGELVIIGHPPKPYDAWADPQFADAENINYRSMAAARRRRGGHPHWSSTRSRSLWLTRCSDCNRGTWFDSAQCRACRGPLADCHGYQAGDFGLEFRRISGPKPASDDPTP